MKVLHLTLKKRWFDMIDSGEKTEEYRDLKLYWASRLLYKIPVPWGGYLCAWKDIVDGWMDFPRWKSFSGGAPVFESFEHITARNGYAKDARTLSRKVLSISIGEGRQEWGAEPGKKYFVIKLGERIN